MLSVAFLSCISAVFLYYHKQSEETTLEFEGRDEKEALMLYEALGKEICKKYGFNYSRLLEMMVKREEKRKG